MRECFGDNLERRAPFTGGPHFALLGGAQRDAAAAAAMLYANANIYGTDTHAYHPE